MGFLSMIKRQNNRQSIKARVLKNSEAVLDVMGKNIKGARSCPLMAGQKCIGEFCEFFMELNNTNLKTKKTTKFWRCAFVETPLLLMENNALLRKLIEKEK